LRVERIGEGDTEGPQNGGDFCVVRLSKRGLLKSQTICDTLGRSGEIETNRRVKCGMTRSCNYRKGVGGRQREIRFRFRC
jgi:hypothetical protein